MADEMDKVKEIVESHPDLFIKEREDGKYRVICGLTSHEMSCTVKAVQTYINGKKYKYECKTKLTSDEKELCSQYLIEKRRDQLYCKLTKRYLNNKPHQIRQHLNGRRFKKAIENLKNTSVNSTQEKLHEQLETTETDKKTEMWIPSDSESESAEIDELGPEFEEEKPTECSEEDNSYSFDVLDVDKTLEENGDEKSARKQGKKTKLKRSAKHLEKSKKRDKKIQRNTKETPKKKRKMT